jgi:hypothetical protein
VFVAESLPSFFSSKHHARTHICCYVWLCKWGNSIGAEGVAPIAEALCSNRCLTHLNLWGNIIGGGVYAFADQRFTPATVHMFAYLSL